MPPTIDTLIAYWRDNASPAGRSRGHYAAMKAATLGDAPEPFTPLSDEVNAQIEAVMVALRDLIPLAAAIECPDPATNEARAGLQGGLENADLYLRLAFTRAMCALDEAEKRVCF